MPSTADFDAATARLRWSLTRLEQARALIAHHRRQPALVGGNIAAMIDASLADGGAELHAADALAHELLAEIARRRDLCAQFADDMRRWRDRYSGWDAADRAYRTTEGTAWPGPPPAPPPPPFSGAEPR